MRQEIILNSVDIDMVKSKCLKNKNLEICHTQKCFIFFKYNGSGMPCPYYIPPQKERGFSENLNEINGKQIRRMYFNVLIYMYLLIFVMLIVFEFLIAKSAAVAFRSTFGFIKYMFVIIAPLSILSLLNKRLFGRLICVVNENGLYCNQKMLQWSQIKSATYNIDLPSRSGISIGCSSVKIEYGKNLSLIIPHAPRSILKQVIKYSPDTKVGLDMGSKFLIGICISFSILMPIFMFLVKGY